MYYPSWPVYEVDEINVVVDILKSGKVNQWTGNYVKKFEKKFAKYIGTNFAIAVCNGTVALELSLRGLNIQPGDEVIVTSRTFLASASSIVSEKGIPVFADVDPITQNITAKTIEEKISNRTKGIICVHLAGHPCDMDEIISLSKKHKLFIIEDCAQAHGARYKGKNVGTFSNVSAWSFCQDKIISTGGEGGMITTDDYELYKKIWSMKDHGKNIEKINKSSGPTFNFLHDYIGTNLRMTEIQAGIGLAQLEKLDHWVNIRRRNAKIYDNIFKNVPGIIVPKINDNLYYHSYYKYYIFIEKKYEQFRDKILIKSKERNIPCYYGSCGEIYLEKAFDGFKFDECPVAKRLASTSLMLVTHPTLSETDIVDIANNLKRIIIQVLSE